MKIKHTISGNNFHGDYSVKVVGDEDGFALSKSQIRRIEGALCGVYDCKCGGGYGNGRDHGSARMEQVDWDIRWLVPADKAEKINKLICGCWCGPESGCEEEATQVDDHGVPVCAACYKESR
jgi:hypothetical protein